KLILLFFCQGRFIYKRTLCPVGYLPCGKEYQFGSLFQKIVFDLVRSIRVLMVILVHSVEIEYDRNVVLGEVIMVASVIETVRIILVVKSIIQVHVQVFVVYHFAELVQVGAEFVTPDQINVIPCILHALTYTAYHVDIQVGYCLCKRENGIFRIILGSYQSFFFPCHIQEKDGTFWSHTIFLGLFKGFRDLQDGNGSRTIIIGAVVDPALIVDPYVIVMGGDDQYLIWQGTSFNKSHHILGVLHSSAGKITSRNLLEIIISSKWGRDPKRLVCLF